MSISNLSSILSGPTDVDETASISQSSGTKLKRVASQRSGFMSSKVLPQLSTNSLSKILTDSGILSDVLSEESDSSSRSNHLIMADAFLKQIKTQSSDTSSASVEASEDLFSNVMIDGAPLNAPSPRSFERSKSSVLSTRNDDNINLSVSPDDLHVSDEENEASLSIGSGDMVVKTTSSQEKPEYSASAEHEYSYTSSLEFSEQEEDAVPMDESEPISIIQGDKNPASSVFVDTLRLTDTLNDEKKQDPPKSVSGESRIEVFVEDSKQESAIESDFIDSISRTASKVSLVDPVSINESLTLIDEDMESIDEDMNSVVEMASDVNELVSINDSVESVDAEIPAQGSLSDVEYEYDLSYVSEESAEVESNNLATVEIIDDFLDDPVEIDEDFIDETASRIAESSHISVKNVRRPLELTKNEIANISDQGELKPQPSKAHKTRKNLSITLKSIATVPPITEKDFLHGKAEVSPFYAHLLRSNNTNECRSDYHQTLSKAHSKLQILKQSLESKRQTRDNMGIYNSRHPITFSRVQEEIKKKLQRGTVSNDRSSSQIL